MGAVLSRHYSSTPRGAPPEGGRPGEISRLEPAPGFMVKRRQQAGRRSSRRIFVVLIDRSLGRSARAFPGILIISLDIVLALMMEFQTHLGGVKCQK